MKKKYTDPKKLQKKCDDYFNYCDSIEKPYCFSGLAYYLGFLVRHTLNNYADADDKLSVPIKRSMLRIEAAYEERMYSQSPTGAIFALKNRGWSDKQEIEHSGGVSFTVPSALDD